MAEEHELFGVFFLLSAAAIHFTDALLLFNRIESAFLFGVMYFFLFAVAVMMTLISPYVSEEQRKPLVFWYLGLSAWAFFVPFLKGMLFYVLPNSVTLLFDLVVYAFPVWVVFIVRSEWSTHNVRLLGGIYFMFWLTLFFFHFANTLPYVDVSSLIGGIPIQPSLIDGFYPVRQVAQSAADGIIHFWGMIQELPKDIQRAWERQIKIAAGDYYIGVVDTNAEKPLGVFMEKFKPEEKFFYLGEEGKPMDIPVRVSGAIKGQSLDLENCNEYDVDNGGRSGGRLYTGREECVEQQTVAMSCGVKGKKIQGTVKPEKLLLYDIEGGGEGIDCDIAPTEFPVTEDIAKRLLAKTESVSVTAEFPFTTKAYLKTYFMNEERKREMRRSNIDIFSFYKLPGLKPVAVYTGGPVMVGIGIEQDLPLAVSLTGKQRSTRFGITIENRWKGEIENITELRIIPPPQVELVCPPYFEQEGGEWVLSDRIKQREGVINTVKTFTCRIMVKDGEANALLENFPLVETYFKITARYKYRFTTEVPVKLKAGDGIKGELSDCKTFCRDPDGCACAQECTKKMAETPYGKNCNDETPKPEKLTEKPSEKPADKDETEKKPREKKPITLSDCGVRVKGCDDYTQRECYDDICRFNCRYEMPGILTGGKCVYETESILKETNCPQIKKCGDYTGLKPSVCEENLCKLRPGKCYYDYGEEQCRDCSTTPACSFYGGEQTCNKDVCGIGCIWFNGPFKWGCKQGIA